MAADTPPPIVQYSEDLEYLRKHVKVVELKSGAARVAVVPDWQGRVMTSTTDAEKGRSLGWLHRENIAAGIQPEAKREGLAKHIHVFGGEERLWFGPEGGPYSLFFPPGVPQEFAHWKTPALIDTEPFSVEVSSESSAVFTHTARLSNRAGSSFSFAIRREVKILDKEEIEKTLGISPGAEIGAVAYRTENRVTNTGEAAWKKESGLISIWMLGMFPPSEGSILVLPLKSGGSGAPNTNYTGFGQIPPDRAIVKGDHLFFKGDGKARGKLGVPPSLALPFSGCWQSDIGVLTLVHTAMPADASSLPYVDSQWKENGDPYAGDVINAYNDGPPEPGAKPLGPFFELETSSPALALAPGASHEHRQTTLHFTGPKEALDPIARKTLGVSLAEIEKAFAK
ncbi:MAG: DUF6786 family protein [Verrucomicrobiales bacterium]